MKFATLIILSLIVVLANCGHTFLGTNVHRPLMYHKNAKYSSYLIRKRIEYLNYTIPYNYGRYTTIQGILVYDLKNSAASCNVTAGGLGTTFVSLRMKSESGRGLNYDIYIYA